MPPNILLDMDGVLANFVYAACAAHGRPYQPETLGQYNIAKQWGITAEEFWAPLSGEAFWGNLDPYPWANDLHKALMAIAPVTVCSAPSLDPFCTTGKLLWLKKHLGVGVPNVIFANKKDLLAMPSNILVDDSDRKVDAFTFAGGRAVIFPQPWNSRHLFSDKKAWKQVVKAVETEVEEIRCI